MMLEKKVEQRLVRGIVKRGGVCWKWVSPGKAGVPDRIAILPGPSIWFIELKTDVGRLTALQRAVQAILTKLGCNVTTLYGPDGVDRFLSELDLL